MEIQRPESKQPMPETARQVFTGLYFDVYQWEQEGFDGRPHLFEKVRRRDTTVIIPVLPNKRILIAEQAQPGRVPYLGYIGGRIEEEESPVEGAKRELQEETGHVASEWRLLSARQPFGKIDWAIYVFVARGLEKVTEPNLDPGTERIQLQQVTFNQFVNLSAQGLLNDHGMEVMSLRAKLYSPKMNALRKAIYGDS